MNKEIKADDVIFNFFKQICDEKDDVKCVELGNSWINAMKTNLTNMEKKLDEADKAKHQENIDSNICLLYTSPSPRDVEESRMPSSA